MNYLLSLSPSLSGMDIVAKVAATHSVIQEVNQTAAAATTTTTTVTTTTLSLTFELLKLYTYVRK